MSKEADTKLVLKSFVTDSENLGDNTNTVESEPAIDNYVDSERDVSDLLLDRLHHNATVYPNKRAMAFIVSTSSSKATINHELTYGELELETDRLAKSLLEDYKLQKGDRYGYLLPSFYQNMPSLRAVLVYPPSLHFSIAFIACLKANILAVPVFPPNPVRRDSLQMFAVIVEACGAKIALTNTIYQHTKKLVGIRDSFQKWSLSQQKRSSVKKNGPQWPESLLWIVTDVAKVKAHSRDVPLQREVNDERYRKQVAFLQFTSGSTSDPKGVMISHGNLAHNLHCITKELKAVDDTVVVSWLPQYHDMGLIGSVLGCIYCGGTGYYMSPLTFLQRPSFWVECISRYKGTHLQAPNFAYKLTARKFLESRGDFNEVDLKLDLSSVRHAINAAEPVDEESIQLFYEAFKPFGLKEIIYPTYGLAEHTVFVCSGGNQVVCVNKEELEIHRRVVIVDNTSDKGLKDPTSKLVGCGFPSSQGIDVRIVNYDNSNDSSKEASYAELDEDVVGEIWIRSPSKALGYYNKPKETAEDFHAQLNSIDRDIEGNDGQGFLRTGDLGFYHKRELFICGRLKDLIIIGGRNYYPQDIEATAETTSDLIRLGCSAAFTIDPTKEGGEEVALVMELKDVPVPKDIEDVCAPLANQIRSMINLDHSIGIYSISFLKPRTVPKTSSGKIARSWCRKAYIAGTLNIVYQKLFKAEMSPSAVEPDDDGQTHQLHPLNGNTGNFNPVAVRTLSKEEILKMIIKDIAKVGNIDSSAIDKKTSIVHILDSLSITQFKGLLENNYAVKLSDEYLFREKTTIMKLVEVVKLGYAPDDSDGTHAPTSANTTPMPGQAKGLAGALGCPPGVLCLIM